MQRVIFIALMATAIIMSSCELIYSTNKKPKANSITGSWKLDSISTGNDSSELTSLIVAMAAIDSNNNYSLVMDIRADSIITTYADGQQETVHYILVEPAKNLLIKEDSSRNNIIHYNLVSDSVLSLALIDSVILYLRRK